MRNVRLSQLGVLMLCICFTQIGFGQDKPKAPNKHILTWSAFANNTLSLHRKLIGDGQVIKKTKTGGYAEMPDFYVEHTYFDPKTKNLISRVQWEREQPDQLHTIEVYLYDEKGRVVRDYAAAYLPNYHTVPTQTLISLHNYNGDLHAFRTFDASGYRIVERCTGTHNGKEVNMLLDEDEIADGAAVMQTPAYKACFEGVQEKAGKYLIPQ
jgi:hypothetical protein